MQIGEYILYKTDIILYYINIFYTINDYHRINKVLYYV